MTIQARATFNSGPGEISAAAWTIDRSRVERIEHGVLSGRRPRRAARV
jgi:hypothetical protein